jgi:hypothetical protein
MELNILDIQYEPNSPISLTCACRNGEHASLEGQPCEESEGATTIPYFHFNEHDRKIPQRHRRVCDSRTYTCLALFIFIMPALRSQELGESKKKRRQAFSQMIYSALSNSRIQWRMPVMFISRASRFLFIFINVAISIYS